MYRNFYCLALTFNPRLAKVKVDPHAKYQGQTVQTGERPQTNWWTHGRYQTYYRPYRYTVDKNKLASVLWFTVYIIYSW